MTTSQLVGILTLVGTLLVAGITLGQAKQQITELERRISTLESVGRYLHGTVAVPDGH